MGALVDHVTTWFLPWIFLCPHVFIISLSSIITNDDNQMNEKGLELNLGDTMIIIFHTWTNHEHTQWLTKELWGWRESESHPFFSSPSLRALTFNGGLGKSLEPLRHSSKCPLSIILHYNRLACLDQTQALHPLRSTLTVKRPMIIIPRKVMISLYGVMVGWVKVAKMVTWMWGDLWVSRGWPPEVAGQQLVRLAVHW